ncbi:hypothetical protein LGQ02_10750 [Bacillus shivajii]|uniref:dimethylamine monooxygenase subunit DmmA family protein n=1 Tax=Bacillus shivajii TaxID=1983719 RepID=UPI001CFC41A0|nr:dimethylamine monooxygenase subunit DmmA family protein [Bacillus shivajii]UCZ55160.1 hypothetical protein LGQ02_10750 [Bacillus shivajii]
MHEAFTYISGKRHYLLCSDQGVEVFKDVTLHLINDNHSYERITNESLDADLKEHLADQKIGTYLYGAGSERFVKELKKLASSIGYSYEESQYYICDKTDKYRIFCAHCHDINEMKNSQLLQCTNCQHLLKISQQFSRFHDAYLGEVIRGN